MTEEKNLVKNLMFVRYSKLENPGELFEDPELIDDVLYDKEDKKIGKVRDILIDSKTQKMMFLEITLAPELEPDKVERNFLVPIGLASFDDHGRLTLDHLLRKEALMSPRYKGDDIDISYLGRLVEEFPKVSQMGSETKKEDVIENAASPAFYSTGRLSRRHRSRSREIDWTTEPETRKKF